MTSLIMLTRKNVGESRWLLVFSCLALFWLSWLFVYATYRFERSMRENANPFARMQRGAMVRAMGGPSADDSSTSFEIALWRHPFIILVVMLWPISRGSAAIAGELDKGGLDLVLSRPVSRSAFLTAQVLAVVVGLTLLATALVAGNQIGNRFNYIESPPALGTIVRPALNYMALGIAVFGVTLFLSSYDLVRWRPMLLGSTLALACYIATIVSGIPSLPDWKWLENLSIFTLYDPVEAAIKGIKLTFNAGLLSAIGASGTLFGYLVFNYRDLPSNS